MSFETSFESKQPKLVSVIFETKCLFRLFRFFIETASFGASVQPKLTETNRNKPQNYSNLALELSLLQHSALSMDESVLQQSVHPGLVSCMLHLDVSLLQQQRELPLHVSAKQESVPPLDVSAQQTVLPGSVFPTTACPVIGFA